MKKLMLVFVMILFCLTTSCAKEEKEKEPEYITLQINQIEKNYFLGQKIDSSDTSYIVNTSLDDVYCVGDNVTVSYKEMIEVKADQFEITAIDVKSVEDLTIINDPASVVYKKPVIYLYPEKIAEVTVQLDFHGVLTQTIPKYDEGWKVTAYPDGALVNRDGTNYPYLFWEGEGDIDFDLSQGFCISGEETEQFLREKLKLMGLNEKELTEFIEYWVPYMEKNPYNKISFQTKDYTDNAKLTVNPKPDSEIRIFMVYQASDHFVEMEGQTLQESERTGFTLIEWGGCEINE